MFLFSGTVSRNDAGRRARWLTGVTNVVLAAIRGTAVGVVLGVFWATAVVSIDQRLAVVIVVRDGILSFSKEENDEK